MTATDQKPEIAARLERLSVLLQSDPENGALLTDCADLAFQLGRAAEAQSLAERALATAPGSVSLRYNLGYVSLHARRYAEAKAALLPIADDPDAPPHTRHLLARALHCLGEVKEAVELASKQVERDPEDAMASGMLSLLCLDANDFDGARRWSEHALARQPGNLDALLATGTVALGDELQDRAKEVFAAALEIDPSNGRAWAGLGMADMLDFDVDAALGKFEKATAHMPDYSGTWNALAWCQMLGKDFAGAKRSLERALAIDRNVAEVHGSLAMLAAYQGRVEEARQHAKRATALDPMSFGGRMVSVLEMQRAGKGELARELVERGLKSFKGPSGATLAETLNRAMLRRKQVKLPASGGRSPEGN